MKILVIYKSKTGFTKTYAEWIAEELKCDIKECSKMEREAYEMKEIVERSFSQEQLKRIKVFFLRGGFDFNKLSIVNKILMSMFKIMRRASKNRSEDDENMLRVYEKPEDHRDKKNIKELITYVSGLK